MLTIQLINRLVVFVQQILTLPDQLEMSEQTKPIQIIPEQIIQMFEERPTLLVIQKTYGLLTHPETMK